MSSTIMRLGRRGQITFPRTLRRQLGLREGDHVAFLRLGDHITLQPLTQTLFDLRGSVPVDAAQDFTAIRRQVIETRVSKVAQDEA